MSAIGPEPLSSPQVWLVDLEATSDALADAAGRYELLSLSERDWPTEGTAEIRRLRRLTRIALRVTLAHTVVPEARGGEITPDDHGKPRLLGIKVAFNTSHAGSFALIGIAPGQGPLGVDLECEREVHLRQRRQSMIEYAAASLTGHPPANFLAAWTSLEALAKARSTGIGALLTDLGITARGEQELNDEAIASSARAIAASTGLKVAQLTMPEGLYGAVAGPSALLQTPPIVRAFQPAHCDLSVILAGQ